LGDDITSHMKILFYGAGVIGSIYSAKLYKRGIDVTLLARGKKYENLKQNGVIINHISRGEQIVSKIPLIYGRDNLINLLKNYGDLKKTLNASDDQFSKEWYQFVREKYLK